METGTQLLVSLDWQTIIVQLINLGIQVILFKKFLYKPVMKVLEKRQNMVDEPIKEAEKAKEEALSMKSEYEANLSKANEEAERIVKDATGSATKKSEKIVSDARQEAAAIKEQAQRDIEQQKRKAVSDAKDEIGSMAMEIASKVIGREITGKDNDNLVDEFIRDVGETTT
ncbi:F0F1 ATP synthase subunit B [Butyrivibrio sp. MC2013]|uniref:F0F1 ATP synthase subunit B n=1 Tax=Butyrivibrio sp. MC2013 TaxID=1280686 RepID=UPI00041EA83A|nr:F0F1 ATP synthase subunit B [Butyrivibrio sp. MC2013]